MKNPRLAFTSQGHQKMLLYATLASVMLWLIPYGSLLTLPLQYLNTIIHEMAHAIAALVTGGQPLRIGVFVGGNGVTYSTGGIGVITASAGYVGASLVGAMLIRASRKQDSAQRFLLGMGIAIAIGLALWIRGDVVGLTAALFWSVGLVALAKKLRGNELLFAGQFLGLQQCLNSLQAVFVLLKINAMPGIENDALFASQFVPFPPMLYALGWAAISFGLVGWALWGGRSGTSSSRAG